MIFLPAIGAIITFIIIIIALAWRLLLNTDDDPYKYPWVRGKSTSNIGGDVSGEIVSGGATGPDKYQRKVLSDYKHLRPSKNRIPYSEFCYPKGFKVQPQQKLVGEYLSPGHILFDSFLVIHKIGAGKTCLSIQVGLRWRNKPAYTRRKLGSAYVDGSVNGSADVDGSVNEETPLSVSASPTEDVIGGTTDRTRRPLYVMPASLIPGFRGELRSQCAGTTYLTAEERKALQSPGTDEYTEIIARSDSRIDADFNIMSYNKFAAEINKGFSKVAAPILIIDELQNINTPGGKYFSAVCKWVEHFAGPIILMSATPLFDGPEEIQGIATLMRLDKSGKSGKSGKLQVGTAITTSAGIISPDDIRHLFTGRVSYYEGAPDYTFPDVMIRVKKCKMSQHQAKWYRAQVEAEMKKSGDIKLRDVAESFYIKSRQKSNIVYPKGLTGIAGMDALTDSIIKSSLDVYSAKYAVLVRKLLRGHGPESLSFVYTGFTGAGGIAALKKCLIAVGFADYFVHGPGRKRFVCWSGAETLREKQIIKDVFNSSANDDASQIQVVIGSSAIKEGVSLMRVRTVHLLETYWNFSRIDQIIGRAVRYCSHKILPARDRSVLVYIYAAVTGTVSKEPKPEESIDLYMLNIAEKKRDEVESYMEAFADVAVDRLVHYP